MQQSDQMEARFALLATEWRSTAGLRAPRETRFAAMKAEALQMQSAGHWVSGPGDLLTILGRQRDELFHSRVLAWLLNPTGRHGLGDRFLRAFLDAGWPGESFADGGSVQIDLERTGSGVSADTGESLEARADLVIRLETVVFVIENKLDAGEQEKQCERLYWSWAGEPTDVRWLFLTPNGRPPVTATSDQARAAWRTLSYIKVRRALMSVLDASTGSALETGRASARQYLATLASQARS
jgi:hypothetical protein